MSDFRKELETLINCHSKENGSDTPDWILAQYLTGCLANFDLAVRLLIIVLLQGDTKFQIMLLGSGPKIMA